MIRQNTLFTLLIALAASLLMLPAYAAPKKVKARYAPPSAAMAVDLYSGRILHAKNAYEPRYPASLTKVMTLYLLFDALRDGTVTLKTELPVSANAAAQPPSKIGLKPGDTIAVSDAISALVTKSANDIAVVVAEALAGSEEAFARKMTQKARTIGMTNTTFRNASGLPDERQRSTAHDLLLMARSILIDHPERTRVFGTRFFKYRGKVYRNHNSLLFSYRGMEGMKTGFTNASGFNLIASAKRGDKRVLAVVLGGPSSRSRNAAMRSLLDVCWKKAATRLAAQKMTPAPFALAAPHKPAIPPVPVARPLPASEPVQVAEAQPAEADKAKVAEAPAVAAAPVREPQTQAAAQQIAAPEKIPSASPVVVASAATALPSLARAADPAPAEPAVSPPPAPSAPALAAIAPSPALPSAPQTSEDAGSAQPSGTQPSRRAALGSAVESAALAYEESFPGEVVNMSVHVKKSRPMAQDALIVSATAAVHPQAAPAVTPPPAAAVIAALAARSQAEPADSLAPQEADLAQSAAQDGPYQIQVGSFADLASAEARRDAVTKVASKLLEGHAYFTMQVDLPQGTVFRARYAKFEDKAARKACAALKKRAIDCMVVRVPQTPSKHASR